MQECAKTNEDFQQRHKKFDVSVGHSRLLIHLLASELEVLIQQYIILSSYL